MLARLRSASLGSRGKANKDERDVVHKNEDSEEHKSEESADRGRPPVDPAAARSRSRSGSFRDIFRRRSNSDMSVESNGVDSSVDSEDAQSRPDSGKNSSWSLRGKLGFFPSRSRSDSTASKSDKEEDEEEGEHGRETAAKVKRSNSLTRLFGRKQAASSNLETEPVDAQEDKSSVASSTVTDSAPNKKKKGSVKKLSARAAKLVKSLSVGKAFRSFARKNSSESIQSTESRPAKLNVPASPEQSSVGSPRGAELEKASFPYRHQFTRSDVLYFRSIYESTTTMHETLSELVGEGENDLLLARLAEMVDNRDDLFCALALLRSTRRMDRLTVLFHMHDLSGTGKSVSRTDLRAVLRNAARLNLADATGVQDKATDKDLEMLTLLRLEHFYTRYAPEKLNNVAGILSKYTDKLPVLWKKLEKQYPGAVIPTEQDVMPVVRALRTVDEVVDHAFSFAKSGASGLDFNAFCEWMAFSDPRFVAGDGEEEQSGDKISRNAQPWRERYLSSSQPCASNLGGWMRFADLGKTKQSQKVRLSELAWRRRWCQIAQQPDGNVVLEISKSPEQAPLDFIKLSAATANIDAVERPTHKHRWTIMINQTCLLQPSRASSAGLEAWLCALRSASHAGADLDEGFGKHEEELKREDEEASGSDPEDEAYEEEGDARPQVADVIATRVRAFYLENNPSKVDQVTKILSKYDGNESKLLALLERQYQKKVPSPASAERILAAGSRSKASSENAMSNLDTVGGSSQTKQDEEDEEEELHPLPESDSSDESDQADDSGADDAVADNADSRIQNDDSESEEDEDRYSSSAQPNKDTAHVEDEVEDDDDSDESEYSDRD